MIVQALSWKAMEKEMRTAKHRHHIHSKEQRAWYGFLYVGVSAPGVLYPA